MLILGFVFIVTGGLGAIEDVRALSLVLLGLVIILTTDEYGSPRIPASFKKWG